MQRFSLTFLFLSLLFVSLLLPGCGSKSPTPRGKYAPYTVNGITYYPLKDPRGYRAQGIASYYASAFQGRKTASGERYDQRDLTCAHTTLPFASKVRVTNLRNGRSVLVRVNDRGPFKKGRIVDLSKAAAQELNMLGQGTAKVLVEYAEEDGKTLPQSPSRFFIQVGSFAQKKNASHLCQKLRQKGYRPTIVHTNGTLWSVQIGPLDDRQEAEVMLALLKMITGQAFLVSQ
ncbi:MAG: septal ring lytic transglycosylase RlpA family protein [Desulfovibrio sp.]|nr:septal ring lytic transglycosylase RlpA family protein [Desulfovibrio sp.]